jgi:hypothetical protein
VLLIAGRRREREDDNSKKTHGIALQQHRQSDGNESRRKATDPSIPIVINDATNHAVIVPKRMRAKR